MSRGLTTPHQKLSEQVTGGDRSQPVLMVGCIALQQPCGRKISASHVEVGNALALKDSQVEGERSTEDGLRSTCGITVASAPCFAVGCAPSVGFQRLDLTIAAACQRSVLCVDGVVHVENKVVGVLLIRLVNRRRHHDGRAEHSRAQSKSHGCDESDAR